MGEKIDTAKGLIRGLTADWLGGPVDLATVLANLGIAGGGFAAHKLGLVDTPPDLLDPANVPFSSDWYVKNSPLQNPGTAAYAAGQFTGNLLPGIGSFAKGLAAPRKGQTNALYPGGSDEFLLGHSTSAEALLPQGNLRKELYHPSWGITRNTPPPSFGDTYLIPNPKKFEPRVSPTVIRAGDFYSPRYKDSRAGGGIDAQQRAKHDPYERNALENGQKWLVNFLKNNDLRPGERAEYETKLVEITRQLDQLNTKSVASRELAQARLQDRFEPRFPKGGLWGEGAGKTSLVLEPDISNFHNLRIDASPRFQSFESFEKSPYGGAVVDKKAGRDAPAIVGKLENRAKDVVKNLGFRNEFGYMQSAAEISPQRQIELMKGLAGGRQLPELSIAQDAFRSQWDAVDPTQYRELAEFFQKILGALKRTPTEYAEAKTFGPVGVNPDNIAGIITRDSGHLGGQLGAAAKKRGIPFIQSDLMAADEALFRAAVSMQNESLYKGMGGR